MADLTTAAAVQAYLALPSTQDTTLLGTLVSAVSDWVQSYIGYAVLTASYTETQNGSGTDVMILRQQPVTAVSSVTVDGVAVLAASGPPATGAVGYLFDSTALYYCNGYFPEDRQNVTVTYTAGYSTVPLSLAQACVEMVALKYRRIQNLGKTSDALAGETTSYNQTDVPGYVLPVLDTFRRNYQV